MNPTGTVLKDIDEAVAFIKGRSSLQPRIGLVLGSGLGAYAKTLDEAVTIPYGEIPHFATSTAVGHQGALVLGTRGGVPLAVMAGRVHFYEGYSMTQVVFPARVLGRLGVQTLIVTNAAGGVNLQFACGDIMVIDDHINLIGTNPMIGPNETRLGERFFDLSDAYDPELRALAGKAIAGSGLTGRHGVYLAFSGPSYETPAEIRMARILGADAVGMSTVPEVIAARHMGLRVLGLSCITNLAAGVLPQKLDHAEVLEVGERVKAGLIKVLDEVIAELAKQP